VVWRWVVKPSQQQWEKIHPTCGKWFAAFPQRLAGNGAGDGEQRLRGTPRPRAPGESPRCRHGAAPSPTYGAPSVCLSRTGPRAPQPRGAWAWTPPRAAPGRLCSRARAEGRGSEGAARKATHIFCQMGLLCSAPAEARNS